MIHDSVGRARAGVHPDEERGVAAALEEGGVLGPLVLDDELAVGIEILGDERVERPSLPGAVAIHDNDLGGARGFGAAHGRVDLLRVELAALLVQRLAAGRLLPLHDAGDALHVRDDVDAHGSSLRRSRRGLPGRVCLHADRGDSMIDRPGRKTVNAYTTPFRE